MNFFKQIKVDYSFLILGYILLGLSSLSIIIIPTLYFSQSQIGALGVCLSLQYILSQFFGLGFHFSSLYYKSVSNSTQDNIHCTLSSMINVSVIAIAFGTFTYFFFPLLAKIYDNFFLDDFKLYLIISTIVIAINRVLFSELNASKKFSIIGLLYTIKSIIFCIILILLIFNLVDFKQYINYQLLLPELVIYFYYLYMVISYFNKTRTQSIFKYFKRDLIFGLKSMWGTIFLEASTKVDVLMLGVFVNPEKVGVYSVISMISDMFLNISTAIRIFINPDITINFIHNKANFKKYISQKIKIGYMFLVPILIAVVILFFIVTTYFPKYHNYNEGFNSLLILSLFLSLVAGFIPLMLTFGQIGKPNLQSTNFLILFISNVILNYFLIPLYGIEGASIATGLAYLIYMLFFKTFLKHIKI